MKLTDAEWRWDRKKLTFYFTSEKRVDFRGLVRDMAAKFRTRIELKQIGVRDEARRLDGVGRCGRQYCSASWLPELRPVNLGFAKDQKLSLNPTQISGACGRLMCCLRYEHDWYVKTRRQFPKEGKLVTSAVGEEKVVYNDLFRERVTLRRMSDGELRTISLAQLNKELRGEPIESDEPTGQIPPEAWDDELLSMTDTVERPIPGFLRSPRPEAPLVSLERAPERPEKGRRAEKRDDSRAKEGAGGKRDSRIRDPKARREDAGARPSRGPRTEAPASPREKIAVEPRTAVAGETRDAGTSANTPDETPAQKDARQKRRRGRRRKKRNGEGGSGSPPTSGNPQ